IRSRQSTSNRGALKIPKIEDIHAVTDISMERTWTPLLMVLGHAFATVSLYMSATESSALDGAGEDTPIVIASPTDRRACAHVRPAARVTLPGRDSIRPRRHSRPDTTRLPTPRGARAG